MNQAATTSEREWQYKVDLQAWVGSYCHIETTDGSTREGKITDFDWHALDVNGGKDALAFPIAVELNGDPIDRINFTQIRRIKLK